MAGHFEIRVFLEVRTDLMFASVLCYVARLLDCGFHSQSSCECCIAVRVQIRVSILILGIASSSFVILDK